MNDKWFAKDLPVMICLSVLVLVLSLTGMGLGLKDAFARKRHHQGGRALAWTGLFINTVILALFLVPILVASF